MKNVILFISMLAVFMLLYSCDENSSKPDPKDPCEGVLPVKADFIVIEKTRYGADFINYGISRSTFDTTYTILHTSIAYFEAIGDYDDYTWILENDPTIYKGKKFSIGFFVSSIQYFVGDVNVTLIVEKKLTSLDSACLSNLNTKDTIVKTISVKRLADADIVGQYEVTDERGEKRIVKVYTVLFHSPYDPILQVEHVVENCFCQEDNISSSLALLPMNRVLGFYSDGATLGKFSAWGWGISGKDYFIQCYSPWGLMYLTDDNNVVIEFIEANHKDFVTPVYRKHYGRRIK